MLLHLIYLHTFLHWFLEPFDATVIGTAQFLRCFEHQISDHAVNSEIGCGLGLLFEFQDFADQLFGVATSMLGIFLTHLSNFLALDGIRSLHTRRFPREDVLNGEDLVKELELLFGDFFVHIVNKVPIKLIDMLESVNHKTFQD